MSVALEHRAEPAGRRQALVVAAAALGTLLAIGAPLLAGALGVVARLVPADGGGLSPAAQRVLAEVPDAYLTGGLVVIPAASDPDVLWTDQVPPERITGPVVDLGVRALAGYGYLHSRGTAPAWMSELEESDRVFSDAGPLSFGCTRWPGTEQCTGTLLVQHDGEPHVFRSGLAPTPLPLQSFRFRVLDGGEPAELVFGGAPRRAVTVLVTLPGADGRSVVRARTAGVSLPGASVLWWASVAEAPSAVTFLDHRGAVLHRWRLDR